ncbi:hypothetical protein [Streptomyces sp. SBT349]|uniref:hypothetical protein n=1 Tax=Streptomyces sp. SBT349 TaxID=1580539 RepID=UPI00131EB1F5|nr:hypothetical protein [Streptomyces sp. SBT349]
MNRNLGNRIIEITEIDDVSSGERVIEFRDPGRFEVGAHVAIIIPEGGGWAEAMVSINPHISEISAEFIVWLIGTAQAIVQNP